jgi:hypothetical protein
MLSQSSQLFHAEQWNIYEVFHSNCLLLSLSGKSQTKLLILEQNTQDYLCKSVNYAEKMVLLAIQVTKSPLGEVFFSQWGSLRYASNAAFICLMVMTREPLLRGKA